MANWQRTLNLFDVWPQASAREITAQALAGVISTRLRALKPFGNEDVDGTKDELEEEFEGFTADDGSDFDNLDYLLQSLYDWADMNLDGGWNGKKACWVKTF